MSKQRATTMQKQLNRLSDNVLELFIESKRNEVFNIMCVHYTTLNNKKIKKEFVEYAHKCGFKNYEDLVHLYTYECDKIIGKYYECLNKQKILNEYSWWYRFIKFLCY